MTESWLAHITVIPGAPYAKNWITDTNPLPTGENTTERKYHALPNFVHNSRVPVKL